MRDHDPRTIREFLGTYDREDDDSVPIGYFRDSRNVRFITGGVKSREGTTLDVTIGSVKRMAIYKRIGEAQRLLILDDSGNLYDSTSLSTPILSIVAMTDFSVEVMFNRAYITPHNGRTGLAGEKVYVYEGSGTARAAAGSPPSGFNLVAIDSAESGDIEAGTRIFAVCYETVSGHLTKPGGFVAVVLAGSKKADISNLPIGPSGTSGRQIVATKLITDFNGDAINQEYFIVPDGRIANNVDTEHSVSFFDADLQSSADYLMDELSEIPAGVGIRNYRGRLCVWGEDLNPSIIRISKAGFPESHDSVEGYATVNPGDSGDGIRNVAEYRTQLIIFKGERAYVTQDNGESAAFWQVDGLDSSVGTECHGVARIRDFGDNLQDRLFIASRQGFHMFVGSFSDSALSDPIDAIWTRITDSAFHTIELSIDPVEALIYLAVPLDGATAPNHLLVMDWQEGFARAKWTIWTFPVDTQTIVVDVDNTTKTSVFKFGAPDGNVYKLNTLATDDFLNAISAWITFPHIPEDSNGGGIFHFGGIQVRVKGIGNLDILVEGLDAVQTITPSSLVMSAAPGRELWRGMNFLDERASVKLSIDGSGERFTITKFSLFTKLTWLARAE